MQKILIINLMYIGDLLFTTPLVRTLRTNFPNAHIAMLVDEINSAVIKHNPHLSEVIAIDKKGYHNKLSNFIKLIGDIRKQNFDLVINLHRNERASALAAFSGAKCITGFAAKGFGIFFDKLIKERIDIHQVEAYLETLKAVGIQEFDNQGLEMWMDQESTKRAKEMWQEIFSNISTQVIGLNTGGSWPTKRWKSEGFAKLADKLLETGYGVAFFGGPMDKLAVESILNEMKSRNSTNLAVFTGKTSLLEMASLVQNCRVLVTGDSGPMHIAVSQKVKVVALFGPSNCWRYAPYGQENSIIVSEQLCLSCGKHNCSHHRCMEDITAEQVYQAILS